MKQMWRGIVIGVLLTVILAAFLVPQYGAWKEKIGNLKGKKEGMITIIDFLAQHFSKPDGRKIAPNHQIGLKWYTINVIETNGIVTLQVNNEL